MPVLLRHRTTRFLLGTAAIGSLADWTLFATLVVTVDALTGGSPWATAGVLLARIVPGVAFAPLAARRADRADLTRVLRRHELGRLAGVAGVCAGLAAGSVAGIVAAVLVLEYCAAILAATRESVTSRHVPPTTFTAVNTVTAVLSYGLLPIGSLLVALTGPATGWVVALSGYTALALAYRTLRLEPAVREVTSAVAAAPVGVTAGPAPAGVPATGLVRTVAAASLALVPAVLLFAVGPDLAGAWLGDRTATGVLLALALVGGAAGFAATNLLRLRVEAGMAVALGGLLAAGAGAWQPGLVALGFGAGAAYLGLQTRLQHVAVDPSRFAAAFAALKVSAGVATLAAPLVVTTAGAGRVPTAGAVAVAAALVVATEVRWLLQRPLKAVAITLLRVEVVGAERRVDGPAVVVSNHPHWVDGPVAKVADESLRPIARWQRSRVVRAALWVGDAVVTTARTDRDPRPAFQQAADHLRAGGRIWLAPEGGCHTDPALRTPRTGAVRMADAAGVPVQPLAILHERHPGPAWSAWRPWRRLRVSVVWGEPVRTTGDVEVDGARMMLALAAAGGFEVTPQVRATAAGAEVTAA
ncbi:MAG: 1-acyl-sn-glycerol-3-phosphate acyltransferase [Actinomycetes bacterium]